MDNTDDFIKALANSAEPVKPSASPMGIFLRWVLYSAIYEVILLLIFGLRPDLEDKLDSDLFIADMLLLASVVVTSALSAVYLSFPDLYQRKWLVYLPIIPFLALAGVLYYAWFEEPLNMPKVKQGIECLLCVTLFSVFSAVSMMIFLKKQATTHYYLAGAVSFLASSSLGSLVFRLCEPIDSVAHLVTWHYMPVIGFMAVGMVAGKKFLRW